MKSRVRFLFKGIPYGFKPLNMRQYDGMKHVASLSLDQYNYLAIKHGFNEAEVGIDRFQSTSRWLPFILLPAMLISRSSKKYIPQHNQKDLLLERLLFMVFTKRRNNSGSG
jgi:hypothetical protein